MHVCTVLFPPLERFRDRKLPGCLSRALSAQDLISLGPATVVVSYSSATSTRLSRSQTRQNEDDDIGTMDSAVGSGSLMESASLNVEARSLDTFSALVSVAHFKTMKPFRAET